MDYSCIALLRSFGLDDIKVTPSGEILLQIECIMTVFLVWCVCPSVCMHLLSTVLISAPHLFEKEKKKQYFYPAGRKSAGRTPLLFSHKERRVKYI